MSSVYITIDVEDWFQVENLRPAFPISVWDQQEWHVEANTVRLLQILEEYDAKATFFVLGMVAEKFPSLVRKLVNAGHEIASHGYSHRLLYDLSEGELYEELNSSKKILEDISGQEIQGFRAPSFSITDQAVDFMGEIGYRYDSSFNDFGSHDRYGHLDLENWNSLTPGVYEHPQKEFMELPIQNLQLFGTTIPWGGGGYFRMIPWGVFKRGIEKIVTEAPYIFYMHPWEVDTRQPKINEISFGARVRHYTNISKVEDRFSKMLNNFNPQKTLSDLLFEEGRYQFKSNS